MLKGTEKLRILARNINKLEIFDTKGSLICRYADEIEQEVSERCMLLPLDADGVPIRVGDVMETDNGIREVDVLQKSSRKWSIGLVPVGGGAFSWCDAETVRHYHATTVEDVLREVVAEVQLGVNDVPHIVAEYAKRLRLAGDAE